MARNNVELAAQIGQGIGRLFGPPDNNQAMKYMLGASQVAQNNADIEKLKAQAALDTQTHGNRAVFTPERIAGGMGVENMDLAALLAATLGQGGNAQQAAAGLNDVMGGLMVRDPNATEGSARQGLASMGTATGVSDALTAGGLADAFTQAQTIQGMKDDAARYGHDASAAARRYAADQSASATRYGHDNRVWSAPEGSVLFRNNGTEFARGNPKAGGAGAGGKPALKPSDAVAIQRLVDIQAGGNNLPTPLANAISSRSAELYAETGNAQASVAQAFGELAELIPEMRPVGPDRNGYVTPPGHLQKWQARSTMFDPSAPGGMGSAAPPAPDAPLSVDELLQLYSGD